MESDEAPPYTARAELILNLEYTHPEEVTAEALRRIAEDRSLPPELRERQLETAARNLRFALEKALGPEDLLPMLRGWEDGPVRVGGGSVSVWLGQHDEPPAPSNHPRTVDEPDEVLLRLIRKGRQLPGLNFISGMYLSAGPAERELQAVLREVAVMKGLIHEGAGRAVDGLFEDVVFLEQARLRGGPVPWEETSVLAKLPPELRERYDGPFARKFLAVVVDVSGRMAQGWLPPPTYAHEMALQLILDLAEEVQTSLDVAVREHWASDVADYLQVDLDDQMYSDQSPPGVEGHLSDFDNWFTPFLLHWHPVPYARD